MLAATKIFVWLVNKRKLIMKKLSKIRHTKRFVNVRREFQPRVARTLPTDRATYWNLYRTSMNLSV